MVVILVWTRLNFYVHKNRDKITMGQMSPWDKYQYTIIMAMNLVGLLFRQCMKPVTSWFSRVELIAVFFDGCKLLGNTRLIKHHDNHKKSCITKCIKYSRTSTGYSEAATVGGVSQGCTKNVSKLISWCYFLFSNATDAMVSSYRTTDVHMKVYLSNKSSSPLISDR